MVLTVFIASPLAAMFAVMPAAAQSPPRPPKPYEPVAITRPAPSGDESFIAFRAALAAAAKTRIYGELSPLMLTQGFFWDRDFGQHFDPRRPAVDNLAAAIALEQANGAGWDALAAFAAEAAVEPLESRPGVVCAPARPNYDGVAFSRLLDVTYTGGIDWAYPRADEACRAPAPQPGAAKAAHSARISSGCWASRARTASLRLAVCNGRGSPCQTASKASSLPGSLMSLTTERLCYIKDLVGGWRIAGSSPAATRSNFRKQEKCAVEPARPQQRLILT